MRQRRLLLPALGLAAAAVLVAVLALAACSGKDSDDTSESQHATTSSTAPKVGVALQPGPSVVASAGPDVKLDAATRNGVLGAAKAYVANAVLAPLTKGSLGSHFGALFDPRVGRSAVGADRVALADEGVGKVVSTPTIRATPVRFDALADGGGRVVLVATSFSLDVRAETAAGPATVKRTMELTYAPGPKGTWRITAYRVTAARATTQGTTTTTAAKS